MAALREKMFRMRFLKIAAADFLTWNLGGDGENGNAAAVAIVKPIDQMQVGRAHNFPRRPLGVR